MNTGDTLKTVLPTHRHSRSLHPDSIKIYSMTRILQQYICQLSLHPPYRDVLLHLNRTTDIIWSYNATLPRLHPIENCP
ncbi:hypothetical protein IAQ61_006536 [Plenodomus lingam]|uniref:uncharacterized protein n=1 Tax=Leptosphaeria maculans TaxID=5022 RepID=UPI00331A4B69|nr:hypothetical protein IAQ61_006536 [Plenodomus lingam]